MLSKNHQKLILSLQQKKFRLKHKQFIAEGSKIVLEAINKGFSFDLLLYTNAWLKDYDYMDERGIEVSEKEMKKLSNLKSPPGVLAIFPFLNKKTFKSDITLVLDKIQDPGNLGTMIRTAHAFGCKNIYCSYDSVDCYNPKVVQATMGSLFNVNIEYVDILNLLTSLDKKKEETIYSFDLNGEDIYESTLQFPAIILLGNESNGVRQELDSAIDKKLKITISEEIDSLNVSVSQAIALAEFKRVLKK